jgi:hypothetical protein|tara:strand:- start:28108 stop:28431 length:324 start_codon:yes stop_codon:yes gene_type:complete
MSAGEPVKWRVHFNQLIARPIPKSEYPKLIDKMLDDGLVCLLTPNGYQWYSGRYRVSANAVREMWNLSASQWRRFMEWVYIYDPFSITPEEYADGEEVSESGGEESR